MKLTPLGNPIWTKNVDVNLRGGDGGRGIGIGADGHILYAGKLDSGLWVANFLP